MLGEHSIILLRLSVPRDYMRPLCSPSVKQDNPSSLLHRELAGTNNIVQHGAIGDLSILESMQTPLLQDVS